MGPLCRAATMLPRGAKLSVARQIDKGPLLPIMVK